MTFDISSAIAAAKATAPNMTEAQKGGGTYVPPAAGIVRCRFIAYYELGNHTQKVTGKPDQKKDMARLVFELSGPGHEPKPSDKGPIPERLSIDVPYSLNEKAHFFKLFSVMNWEHKATHIAELLGGEYLAEVIHVASKSDATKVYASLKGPNGYTIKAPQYVDPLTATTVRVPVDPAITPLSIFLWNNPSKAMWDSIYIDGEYEEGKSKNVIQEKIMAANNFIGSPIHQIIASGTETGMVLGASQPQPTPPANAAAQADPLAGLQ
jgi:hypothetical protein